MNPNHSDEQFMRQALALAKKGTGLASPNPLVGALVVRDGEIVGQGFHRYAEKKHAEVWALEEAGERSRQATLYLNLEPCCHAGRTPPCTDLIIHSGLRRVVAAMTDPNPQVAGRGFELLRRAGILVETGVLEAEARKLNEAFAKFIRQKIPFVTLKAGMTWDGKIAEAQGGARRITGEAAGQKVHEMRHAADGLLVGINTVLADDPLLTDRSGLPRRRPLCRVVLDFQLRCPLGSRLLQSRPEGDIIIFCGSNPPRGRQAELERLGVEVVPAPADAPHIPVPFVLETLGRRQMTHLMVEGGGQTHFEFLKSGCVDKVVFFMAPRILGGKDPLPVVAGEGFQRLENAIEVAFDTIERVGDDLMVEAYVVNPPRRETGNNTI